jgi:lipopolysaccharide export system permease protein
MLAPFFLSAGIITATVLLGKTFKLVEMVVSHGVGPGYVFWFVVSVIPTFLGYTLSISFLIAVLFASTRLSSDSEFIAMKAAGISLYDYAKPIFAFGAVVYAASLLVTLYLYPWGNINAKRVLFDVARTKTVTGIEEKTFYDSFKGIVLYVDRVSDDGTLEGLFISEGRANGENNIILARRGVFVPSATDMSISLVLEDGSMHRRGKGGDEYHAATFKSYAVALDLKKELERDKEEVSNRELYVGDLLKRIEGVRARGWSVAQHLTNLHKRFAMPAAVFAFALIGIPLGLQRVRSAKFTGFSLSLGVILVYYVLFKLFETLGENGRVPPVIAVWSPNVIVGSVGAYVFYMTAMDRQIKSLMYLYGAVSSAVRWVKRKYRRGPAG